MNLGEPTHVPCETDLIVFVLRTASLRGDQMKTRKWCCRHIIARAELSIIVVVLWPWASFAAICPTRCFDGRFAQKEYADPPRKLPRMLSAWSGTGISASFEDQ